ncbi:hypothetical protein GS399_04890 [Pedobacter sp. HMF7647]|uniref:DNA-binding protein n=1 Tax=Hufsiella arboris TaxID=2695275 RepID=A0A7K1Y877_9SPHI|nr:hypothetical protein [Hufsiella arboris]MXV50299.1 hypothetical protein [Hufsiella arboris]
MTLQKIIYAFLFVLVSHAAFSQDSVSTKSIKDYYQKEVKVYGTVSGAKYLEQAGITLINIDGTYPDNALTVVIKGDDRKKFNPSPEIAYINAKIMVTGTITVYKDKPQIVVTDPKQIRVIP